MLHIYLKYASYWLHIWSKYGYEVDLTTLALPLLKSFTHSGNTKFIIVTQDYFYYGESEDDKLKVQVPRQHEEEYIFLFTNQ